MRQTSFIAKYIKRPEIIKYGLLGLVSGLTSFLYITFLNVIISGLISGGYTAIDYSYVIVFSACILFFIWSRRALAHTVINLSQSIFWRVRNDVIQMVLKSSHEDLEKRKDQVHASLIQDVGVLTQASLGIIEFSTSTVVVIGCFVYMAVISFPLFLVTLGTAVAGMLFYYLGSKKDEQKFDQARSLEDRFMYNFESILNGFKEIHMTPMKGRAIYQKQIEPIAKESYQNNSKAFVGYLNKQMTGQVLFYVLISAILLFFSVTLNIEITVVVSFIFILLYVLGAIENLMVLLPSLAQAKVSARRLNKLTNELENQSSVNEVIATPFKKEDFKSLKASNVVFSYDVPENSEKSFGIGPIDLEIQANDIVFVYGGNGSGKTTFMNVLLGLRKTSEGEIHFNNEKLDDANYAKYRSMFATVFSDFYLFDELYGNENFNTEKAREYLKWFELEGKVEMTENGFSTVDLSTGQRKRLALIEALLEEKPILVMDEWAADQDPLFRKKFYQEIIPELKRQGYTILAITHDDKYYHCSDRLLRMEYGKLVDESNLKEKHIQNELKY